MSAAHEPHAGSLDRRRPPRGPRRADVGRARARQRRLALRDLLRRLRGAPRRGARGPEGRPRRAARRGGDAPAGARGERRRLRGVALQGLARLRQEGRRRGLIASIPPSLVKSRPPEKLQARVPAGLSDTFCTPRRARPCIDMRYISCYFPSTSRPCRYGRNTSGTVTLPSSFWWFSSTATNALPTANPDPFIVHGNLGLGFLSSGDGAGL